jgi:hypothetical protein
MASFASRMVGAAGLRPHTYEEVEADPHAFPQAMGVVVLSAVCAGIGTSADEGLYSLAVGTGVALVGWLVWAWLAWFIGAKILPAKETQADLGQLLRTTGFSAAPGVLRILALFTPAAPAILVISQLWMLAAFVVAVRQALDYRSLWRALLVCLLGWIVYTTALYLITMPAPVHTTRLLLP